MSENAEFSKELRKNAVETARSLSRNRKAKPRRVTARVHADLETLRENYKRLVYSKEQITHAYEWLFDNYYIMEREGRIVIRALSRLDAMPCDAAGIPDAFRFAENFCETAAGKIDAASIETYIDAAQSVSDFDSIELTAFGLMLRAALIERSAEACGAAVTESGRELMLSDAVKTLNFLTTFDFSEIVEKLSRIERILSEDPCGCYPKMDERSRAVYRKRLADIARRRKMRESEAAALAVALARSGKTERERHVGHYILEQELDRPRSRVRGKAYLILLAAVPAAAAAAGGAAARLWWLPFLLYFPLWEALRPVIEYFIMKGVPATFLPRLDLEGSVPEEASTLVVVSTLLSSTRKIDEFAKKLEQFYYSNGHGSISFGILADLKESKLPELPEDKAVRASAVKTIRALNRRCGGRFYLFIRNRRLNETQGRFSGWERKRGAMIELIRCLKGQQTSISTIEGDGQALSKIRYVITLDSDTGLLLDSASEMVSVAMHPLNRPEIDGEKGVVVKGYGILAPRMGVELSAAGKTGFSRIMAGCGGVTAYDNAAGNTYQDLFSEGIFAGKGLIDVEAFYSVLDSALPENRILSHDILEGCFLRAGFLSDVELTDGFPSSPLPWFMRLHRWIRGDWQNIGYMMGTIRMHDGKRKTPLNPLCRFKLFDNLRRSLTSVVSFLCIAVSAVMPLGVSLLLVVTALLSIAGAGLWSALLAVIQGGPSILSRKYHCKALPQTVNSIAQGVLGYLFLPFEAYISADGIVRALWRQRTGRRMLEWTTAADTEPKTNGFWSNLRKFWPVAVAGFAFLFLSFSNAAKIAGSFFIIAPFVAWLSGRETQTPGDGLSEEDKDKLRSYAAATWRYYEDYAGEEDHCLPPDNVQEAPIHVVAHRTSPTNIGLLLLSTLAARDIGLIDSEFLFERISRIFHTVDSMEKWNGHLYNWYDTKTLAPLNPRYVSTVDSGNFLCCLVALREGLKEYAAESDGAADIFRKISGILDSTDLSLLYNKRRKLFHIGYDAEKNRLSDIYYDLLMSEARMTSYYAIAKRVAPKRHWGALGRTLAKKNGYTGPVSWTGTMFEYLMPHLLLPVYEGSMSAEALRFAIYCQKQRAKESGVPWGISESGFYAFDAALNYQYKAHGVQKLALKRGMDGELVVSPYSTFLALPFDPQAGMKNLSALEEMGMYGRCGFFEAADFTFKRTDGKTAVIKSYMAHHVGMSLVSCANALMDGVMQERFLRDNEMRAAKELLEEKIPAETVIFHDVMLREVPDKPGRMPLVREEFEETSPVTPRVQMLSNGEYTLIVTDTGSSLSLFRGIDLTRRSSDLLRNPQGVYAVASFNGTILSATYAPEYSGGRLSRNRIEFNSDGALFHTRLNGYEISMHAVVHGREPCEIRMVELSNYTQKRCRTDLMFYFEPVLAKAADEAAHPAFSRLFLSASYRPENRILVFARRPRGGELPAYLAVGFLENDVSFEFDTSRADILTRPEGIASLNAGIYASFGNITGALPDAAAALRVSTDLPARGKKEFALVLAAANTEDEAVLRLIEIRRQGFHNVLRNAAGKDVSEMESRLAALLLPQILFPVRDGRDTHELALKNRLGQPGLWSLGISGDFPIILLEYSTVADKEKLLPYVRTHKSLRLKGIQVDLVVTYREGGDYARPVYNSIRDEIRSVGCEYLMDSRAGIHLVNLDQHPQEIGALLASSACHNAASGMAKRPQSEPFCSRRFVPAPPALGGPAAKCDLAVFSGKFCGRDFIIDHEGSAPFAPWCQVLANPAFGTVVSDRALGYTWAVNARENKITPWTNDPVSDNRGEMLALRSGTRFFDLIANARVTFRPGEALYETVLGGLYSMVRVFVPDRMSAKFVELTVENRSERSMDFDAAYYIQPVLGVGEKSKRQISYKTSGRMALMRNPWSPVSGTGFLLSPDSTGEFLFSRAAFFSGKWNPAGASPPLDSCAALVIRKKLPPRRREKITFVLGWAAGEDAALRLAERISKQADGEKPLKLPVSDDTIRIETPDERLNVLVNHWLRWQFMSSRIMGRTGFYQCGGAWGFRDQLQDCCAALLLDPEVAKRHIYRAAAHQFREGDVMHWWHQLPGRDGGLRGVRTRCSDDLLWLPYTVCEYVEKTGDASILDREIHYLEGPPLEPCEGDRYFSPARSAEKGSVYLHCVRAIDYSKKYGAHHIPLIGSGDWNDGMNLVGIGGKGESVWLAMFLSLVLSRFARVCEIKNDEARAAQYREESENLKKAVDEHCWDGQWYLRGFYDDGAPLGSGDSEECRIDILPQSFSVLSAMPDAARRKQALDSVLRILCDQRLKIVKLFDPAFDKGGRNPGYIKSYAPGIRENGGQYTHAAVWFAMALLREGRAEEAVKILSMLNPVTKSENEADARTYRLEPYVMAADIYSNPSCEGRGGWSFYTGAAGWYYRTVIESLLGIRIRGDRIYLEPTLPEDWGGFAAHIRLRGTIVGIKAAKDGGKGLSVDGKAAEYIPLDGGEHTAELKL